MAGSIVRNLLGPVQFGDKCSMAYDCPGAPSGNLINLVVALFSLFRVLRKVIVSKEVNELENLC
jgi:hypothetical protein